MNREPVEAVQIRCGQVIRWCGHAFRVESIEAVPGRGDWRRRPKDARRFTGRVDDGSRRTLHYYDRERVELTEWLDFTPAIESFTGGAR